MLEVARSVLVAIGKDARLYEAHVVARDPLNYYLKVPLEAAPARSILFVPKSPTDYPLWVFDGRFRRVEWWQDEKGFDGHQTEVIRRAAAEAWPGVLDPYNKSRYGLRIFEDRDCLVFVFWPRVEQTKDEVLFASDTIVALDKASTRRSDVCDAELESFSVGE
jgi:hypothetical protein